MDKIHVYAPCYNESKLMDYFLHHYFDFVKVDKVFILDNYSTDNSIEAALKWPNVEIIKWDSGGEFRDDLLIDVKNNYWKRSKGKAKYVIVCDIDEFVYNPNLFQYLESKQNKVFQCFGFQMYHPCFPEYEGGYLTSISNKGVFEPLFSKAIIFNSEIQNINYSYGAHAHKSGYETIPDPNLKLLHYKFLGYERVVNIYKEGSKRMSKQNKENRWSHQYWESSEQDIINQFENGLKNSTKII